MTKVKSPPPSEERRERIDLSNKITFDHFYEKEADMFTFYGVPKILFTIDYFDDLTTDGKVLYGLMLDRISLFLRNGWLTLKSVHLATFYRRNGNT